MASACFNSLLDMEGMYRFETINDYNQLNKHKTLHPLVSVLDLFLSDPRDWDGNKKIRLYFGFYCVFLKEFKGCDLRYGRQYYDCQEGTLVFVSPGQIMDVETDGKIYQPLGHVLAFHPDLVHGTVLSQSIDSYNFFGYNSNEALHISDEEKGIVMDCFSKIIYELRKGADKHSKKLIASNMELFFELLRPVLRPPVHHQGQREQGRFGEIRNLDEELFQFGYSPKIGFALCTLFCGRTPPLSQLFW